MIRLALVDKDGKPVLPANIATAEELRGVAEQARNLIRECDRLAQAKSTKEKGVVPYL